MENTQQYEYTASNGLNEQNYYNYYKGYNSETPTNYYYNYFQLNASHKYSSPVSNTNKYYSPTQANQNYGFSYPNPAPYYSSPVYNATNQSIFYNNNSYYYSSHDNDCLPNCSSSYYNSSDSAYQTQIEETSTNSPNRINTLNLSNNWSSNQQSTPIKPNEDKKQRKPKTKRDDCEINDQDNYGKENQVSNEMQVCHSSKRPKLLKLNINPSCTDYNESLNKDQEQINNKNNYNVTNKFNCDKCTVSFNCAAKLIMHEYKVHKGGSTRQCPICNKKFGNQANAMVHLRAHTQEKTFKCHLCENAFYDSSTLKKHLRTHTGEKPYECNLCNKKFTQSGNLKRHLLVHQKYDDYIVENTGDVSNLKPFNQFEFLPEMIHANNFKFGNIQYDINL